MLQRFFGVTLLALHKGVQEQIVPVGTGGEDDPHHHPALLPELIEALILFNGEVLVVGLFQFRKGRLGEIKNLPDQLIPQLGLQPLDELRRLGGTIRGLVNFDTIHVLILRYVFSARRFK